MRQSATSGAGAKLGRRHEILGIVCFSLAVLAALSLWSYDVRGGENWIGPLGESIASVLGRAFGWTAWLVPVELLLAALHCMRLIRPASAVGHAASAFSQLVLGCAFLHLALHSAPAFGGQPSGGVLGELLGEVLRSIVGNVGAYVVCVAALTIALILRTSFSVVATTRGVLGFSATQSKGLMEVLTDGVRSLWEAWQAAQAIEREERGRPARSSQRRSKPRAKPALKSGPPALPSTAEAGAVRVDGSGGKLAAGSGTARSASSGSGALAAPSDEELEGEEEELEADEAEAEVDPAPRGRKGKNDRGPVIIAPRAEVKSYRPASPVPAPPRNSGPFMLPPTELLSEVPEDIVEIDEDTLKENAKRLVEKLEAYGVKGRVDEIHPGPVVTMYEFEPQSGTKISKIAGLSDDLAMALAAQKVRIVAPIPGKARVGFELPNEHRQTVYLRELLEDPAWQQMQGALPVAFGKDIVGKPVFGDLSKMPHLLVAGATGAGKSVGLNVMLVSLLTKKTPEEVRLLMIDPKVVELAVFDGIPHMLLPVVTDMKKASLALRWAVDEMERRYQLFADAGARNLTTYNLKVDKVTSGEMTVAAFAPKRAGKVRALDADGQELLLDPVDSERADAEDWKPERLPSIVLVVDEFADLMMVAAKDVESAVARLAQKARAAGIHVLLATQRPSVDVITGMIKANFPSRIGYKVSQREDSKTILGRTGAEHLLGMGDMLCLLPGTNDLKRVHSAFIGEDEVKAVCDFLRAQGDPVYDDDILRPRDEDEENVFGSAEVSDDPLYDRAVAIVAQAGYCSISHIQRNLSVGYNKAAKLVERMEKEGVVGPASGKAGGRREVFIEAR
ncbi:MAG TPA: DNA translocase FtsK 4TM domain-containing protein [Polyangiales bacterium]|nr:DNA translocase FtsK 4TM domain-containing protein [Polyangiales bacterium]